MPSIRELREICQGPRRATDNWHMKNISRPVSIYLTRLFIMTPLSGNQITVLFIMMGLCASLFFLRGTLGSVLIGALLLQVWYIFDMVDGEVARYKKQTSVTGIYFDKITHYIVHPCIFFCIGAGAYTASAHRAYLFLGFIASLSTILISVVWDLREAVLFGQSKRPVPDISGVPLDSRAAAGFCKRIFMRAHVLCVFPSVMNIITILGIIGFFARLNTMRFFLPVYAACATTIWLFRLIVFVKTKKLDYELQG